MKRILSFVLSLVFIIGILPCLSVSADEEVMTATDRVIAQMRDIGILQGDENGEIEPAATLSRAEFVTLIARIMGIEHHYDSAENDLFVDVPQNHWAKSAILACAKAGYVIGTDDGIFSPEDNVSLEQAIKIMVKVLGYEFMAQEKGGYPAGHFYAANRLELLDNVDIPQTDPVTKGDAAHLFFNALEVPLTEEVGYSDGSVLMSNLAQRTLLAEYLGLARAEGTLDAIYGLSVIDEEISEEGQIIVDGKLYAYEGKDLRSLVGRTVDYFYTIGENQLKSTVKSILPVEDMNQELKISLKDLVDAKEGLIIYEDENENQKEAEIDSTIKYVYNYDLLLDYDIKDLKTIQNGEVILVNNDEDHGYDFAFIYDYETYIVESKNDSMIYGKQNDSIIDLGKDKRKIFLTYHDGREVSLSKIKPNHILSVIETEEILEMRINDTMLTGVYESSGNGTVTVNGKKYDLAKDVFAPNVKLGENVSIYFNPFNQVAYMDAIGVSALKTGYMFRLAEPETAFSKAIKLKFYTEEGKIETIGLAERFVMNNTFFDTKKDIAVIKSNLDYTAENNIRPQLVKYALNDKGEIMELNLAASYMNADEDGFFIYFGTDATIGGKWTQGSSITSNQIYNNTFLDASYNPVMAFNGQTTKVFTVPFWENIATADEQDFRLSTTSGINTKDSKMTMAIYNNSKSSSVADYIVVHSTEPRNRQDETSDYALGVFMNKTTIWEDGEQKTGMEYYSSSGLKTVKIADYYLAKIPDTIAKLSKGDTIRLSTDWNGEVDALQLVYDIETDTTTRRNSSIYYDVNSGYVTYSKDDYVRISPTSNPVKDSTMFNNLLLNGAPTNILVVENNNGRISVSTGSQHDVVVGAKLIYFRRYEATRAFIIYR